MLSSETINMFRFPGAFNHTGSVGIGCGAARGLFYNELHSVSVVSVVSRSRL